MLQAWQIRVDELGEEHLEVAEGMHNLAALYTRRYELQQAEQFYQRMLAIRQDQENLDHPEIAPCLNGIVRFNMARGEYKQAEKSPEGAPYS